MSTNVDRATCPWCGEMQTELWDYPWDRNNGLVITECSECLKPVDIVRYVDVTYVVRKGSTELPGEGEPR